MRMLAHLMSFRTPASCRGIALLLLNASTTKRRSLPQAARDLLEFPELCQLLHYPRRPTPECFLHAVGCVCKPCERSAHLGLNTRGARARDVLFCIHRLRRFADSR
ncbi:hypothetical protein BDW22DRAFT_975964 [Trametopsis cervina]|nr:hypothetical protein BDW22DRAFT_975964 [Trametopsis cervina]